MQGNNLCNSVKSIFKLLFFTNFKLKFPTKCNNNLVVLGNGPSLNTLLNNYKDFLQNKDLFAVNYFALSDTFFELKPANYVMIDFKFFSDKANDTHTLENRPKLWNNISKIDWNINLFLPFEAKKHESWKQYIKGNNKIKLYFINLTAIEGFNWLTYFCFKKMYGMPRPHNVIIPSLMIALKMQYQQIYLWGVDHSWLSQIQVDDNNNALLNNQHFYDNGQSRPDKYILKNNPAAPLHTILFSMMTAFEGYFIIRKYSEKLNIKIYNQTRGSLIDAFERKYLD